MLPEVAATTYVTPLREGGSLPAIMEADDLGTYVVKFRGAGQGRAVADVCERVPGAGSAGQQDIGRRFRWLTAPRSTVVQPGPVHTGLTEDPAAELDRLLAIFVQPVVGDDRQPD
jgi:hypothetical protein